MLYVEFADLGYLKREYKNDDFCLVDKNTVVWSYVFIFKIKIMLT